MSEVTGAAVRATGDGDVGRRWVAVGLVACSVLAWAAELVLATLNHHPIRALTGAGGVAFSLVGALILTQRPTNALGPLLAGGGLASAVGGAAGEYATRALVVAPGSLPAGQFAAWLTDLTMVPVAGVFIGIVPQLFPDGRAFSPRWRPGAWAAAAYTVLTTVGNAFADETSQTVPGLRNPYAVPSLQPVLTVLIVVAAPLGLAGLICGAFTLTKRWRRSHGDERQQLKWFIAATALTVPPVLFHDSSPVLSGIVLTVAFPLIATSLGVAILRYRLYDLNLVVRRAAVYAMVSAWVAAVYLAVVAVADAAVSGSASLGAHLVAAVLAAASFHPFAVAVQRVVERLFYGDRSHPYDVVNALARTIEGSVAPELVLPGVADTVAGALHLPYVEVELAAGDGWEPAAVRGTPADAVETFPLTYQGAVVGRLCVSPRRTEAALHPADREVLDALARQTGVAAHAVQTTLALQRSRGELVSAREEERRRLRRDLHDGLGPTLAGVTLGLHAAQNQIGAGRFDDARALLADVEGQVESAVLDVRRLVYGLRPPALDELGLVSAIRLFGSRLEGAGLAVVVREIEEDDRTLERGRDDGGGSTRLPAAVEVAAYRIATEAMVNVSRHSAAQTCTVTLRLGQEVIVEVVDDGHGLPADGQAGVGLTSMRERAAELSGTLEVDSGPTGTRITARLPFDSWTSPASTPEPPRPTTGPTETRERSANAETRRLQENA
jgi:two-component system, NarL family, sensor kinase